MEARASPIDTRLHEGLRVVPGYPLAVLASPGLEVRAGEIAGRVVRAWEFLQATLDSQAEVALLVLGPHEWTGRSSHPVYGMPNATAGNLIVAGQPNDFWRGFVALIEAAAPDQLARLRAVYGRGAGVVDLHPFFDLLAIHELAHRFPHQVPFRFPRNWLTEFFPNLCLHAYVATVEPERLPDLEVFPAAVAAVAADRLPHHSLADFEALYVDVGAQAYGWYQCRLHAAAKRVYDAAGASVVRRLWDRFCTPAPNGHGSDDRLARTLARDVHPDLASVLTTWPA